MTGEEQPQVLRLGFASLRMTGSMGSAIVRGGLLLLAQDFQGLLAEDAVGGDPSG